MVTFEDHKNVFPPLGFHPTTGPERLFQKLYIKSDLTERIIWRDGLKIKKSFTTSVASDSKAYIEHH